MRNFLFAAAAAATLALPMAPASAQQWHGRDQDRGHHDDRGPGHDRGPDHDRGPGHDRGPNHWAGHGRDQARYDRGDHRGPRADWRRYDWNHRAPGMRHYYADHYYARGNYRPVRVTRYTRIYRGSNGRYYCRRSDGTTGLIVGAALGGILGNSLGYGDSQLAATLLGGAAGGLLGREIDRGRLTCR